ncbi:SKI family transcriptional corepressor 2 [Venturia canescens]|uniref:SKI family transcriptional corepressor 2 n=1 Tax=Venturia canescens TaxID=32260 RepID=UPI001C9C3428|nr:SKI family transcriptional corepressor 2 [Venturia canescens]
MDRPSESSMVPYTPSQKAVVQSSPQPQSRPAVHKELQVGNISVCGIKIVSIVIEGVERLCLAQISSTLLKQFSYNEIHNRRVALGINCVQCTPVQLEMLRRAGAMPPASRRCGMITIREAERLCRSFLTDNAPPRLPDDFYFSVHHECAWGCRGQFIPSRYNSSRAKCIKCTFCGIFFSPNKFIFHSHRKGLTDKYVEPDAANFNSWRRHMKLSGNPKEDIIFAWEDVKAMFNGGTRKRMLSKPVAAGGNHTEEGWEDVKSICSSRKRAICNTPNPRESPGPVRRSRSSPSAQISTPPLPVQQPSTHPRVAPFRELPLPLSRSLMADYVWHQQAAAAAKTPGFAFLPYGFPWIGKGGPVLPVFPGPLAPPLSGNAPSESLIPGTGASLPLPPPPLPPSLHQSAFRPVVRSSPIIESPPPVREHQIPRNNDADEKEINSDDEVDIETMEDEDPTFRATPTPSLHFDSLNLRSSIAASISGNSSNHSGRSASPQCWSPARETEREAEKMAEESAALREDKPESKSLERWHGRTGSFYQHPNVLESNGDSSDRSTPDCSACRPRAMFYGQVHSPPLSSN